MVYEIFLTLTGQYFIPKKTKQPSALFSLLKWPSHHHWFPWFFGPVVIIDPFMGKAPLHIYFWVLEGEQAKTVLSTFCVFFRCEKNVIYLCISFIFQSIQWPENSAYCLFMCMWVIFDQQQLLLSLKGGGQAAREEFWRVTEVGSSQEDGKDGDKLINENTRNKISINSLFDPQITYFLYLYIPPGSTESPTLRIGTSSWNSPASSPNENGWLEDNAHYIFCGAQPIFSWAMLLLVFGVDDPPAGSVSKRLLLDRSHGVSAMRHAEVLTPYLDRSLLETIYRSVGQSLGKKPGVGGWSHGGGNG